MAEIILNIIGVEGQRLAGIQVGKMVGKQICESIRSSFKTDMIEKYKELSVDATKSILDDPKGMEKLTAALSTTFDGMNIDDFQLKSKDSEITGKTKPNKVKDNDNEKKESEKDTDSEKLTVGGVGGFGGFEIPGVPIPNTNNIPSDISKISDVPITDVTTKDPSDTIKDKDKSNINIENLDPLEVLPGGKIIKSAIQGLKPDEGVVPGYLVDALDEKIVKDKMIEGFGTFINELTTKNNNDLKKVFLDVLKEQINAKFREGGEFQQTIIDIIQKKCNAKFDPVAEAGVAEAEAGQPSEKKNGETKEVVEIKDGETKEVEETKENESARKEDGKPKVAEEITGGKSNKPPKRFTRKILK